MCAFTNTLCLVRLRHSRIHQEVFTVASVSKQSRKGSGNVSHLYGLKRAKGEMVSDATSERARQLSVEKRWSQEAPVDGARSRRLSGTVYGLRILPLPAENAPGQ